MTKEELQDAWKKCRHANDIQIAIERLEELLKTLSDIGESNHLYEFLYRLRADPLTEPAFDRLIAEITPVCERFINEKIKELEEEFARL